MDPNRLKTAWERLESIDERLTHKIRPRAHASFSPTSVEQLEDRVRDLQNYTVELREIIGEIVLAFAKRPPAGESGDV